MKRMCYALPGKGKIHMEIDIQFEGHDFRYQAEDTIKLFYPDGKLNFTECRPSKQFGGIFIFSSMVHLESQQPDLDMYRVMTVLHGYKKEPLSREYHIPVTEDMKQSRYEAQKAVKREFKRQLYQLLSQYTGIKMPWGMLTGIRPAKIVHDLMGKGLDKSAIMDELHLYYGVSHSKSALLYETAEVERQILKRSMNGSVGIYIGIPFCTTRCLYCSFTSNPIAKYRSRIKDYMDALKTEIDAVREMLKAKHYSVESIYIGGGTPTSIDAVTLETLLGVIEEKFDLSLLKEYTLEAGRPDCIDREKLLAIKRSRVDRISINPQTMNDETLKLIGRSHTSRDIIEAYELARDLGFKNINMDMIAGLPGENISMFEKSLRDIKNLGPESLTVHTMSIKRASKLNTEKDKYLQNAGENISQMLDLAWEYSKRMELRPYYLYRQKNILGNLENVGYAREGFESIYNIQIMEERQTIIALGAGAITKVVYPKENRIERAFNVKSVEEYITRIGEMIQRKKELLYEPE